MIGPPVGASRRRKCLASGLARAAGELELQKVRPLGLGGQFVFRAEIRAGAQFGCRVGETKYTPACTWSCPSAAKLAACGSPLRPDWRPDKQSSAAAPVGRRASFWAALERPLRTRRWSRRHSMGSLRPTTGLFQWGAANRLEWAHKHRKDQMAAKLEASWLAS